MGFKIISLSAACLTLLVSCGGGGGNSTPPANNIIEEPETTPVSGGVTKGIVRNGEVNLYAVTADGQTSTEVLSSTTTDEAGMFTFDLVTIPDMSFVEVLGRTDGSTLMQCDLTDCGMAEAGSIDDNNDGRINFGEWQVVGGDFRLTGYLAAWREGEPISVNLYTHIVAQSLPAVVDPDALNTANELLQQTLGLKQLPHEVMPIDVTDDVTNANFTDNLLMAALLESTTSSEVSLADKVQQLSASIEEGDVLSDVSISEVTAIALDLSTSLQGDAVDSVTASLADLNEQAAEQENTLPVDSQPILPPFI